MATLTTTDWGRIYAYIWLQARKGNPHYKNLFETDPVHALVEIIETLNNEYPDSKIAYAPDVDAIWKTEPPSSLTDQELTDYRAGIKRANLSFQLFRPR